MLCFGWDHLWFCFIIFERKGAWKAINCREHIIIVEVIIKKRSSGGDSSILKSRQRDFFSLTQSLWLTAWTVIGNEGREKSEQEKSITFWAAAAAAKDSCERSDCSCPWTCSGCSSADRDRSSTCTPSAKKGKLLIKILKIPSNPNKKSFPLQWSQWAPTDGGEPSSPHWRCQSPRGRPPAQWQSWPHSRRPRGTFHS